MTIHCRIPEGMRGTVNNQYRQWARGVPVKIAIAASPPGVSREDLRDVVRTITLAVSQGCGIRTEYTTNQRTANVLIQNQNIDNNPFGILAQAELPYPNQSSGQLGLWNDTNTPWTIDATPPRDKIDLFRVEWHELGHNWGLGHAPQDGSPVDLMDPRIGAPREFQLDWDWPQMLARYGDSTTQPTPPPPPTDPDKPVCLLRQWLSANKEGMSDELRALADDLT